MTETTMYLMIGLSVLMILFVPLVYICVLRDSDVPYRRLIGLARVMKRTTPRKRRQLPVPAMLRRRELDNDGGDSAS